MRLGGAQGANPLRLGFQTLKLEAGSDPARDEHVSVRWLLREVWEGPALLLQDSSLHHCICLHTSTARVPQKHKSWPISW